MNLADINNRITFFTSGIGTDQYTYKDRTIAVNKWYLQVQNWILQAKDSWEADDLNNTTTPIDTLNLVNGTAQYTLTTGFLNIKRVEITYDGINWVRVSPRDVTVTDDSQSVQSYNKSQPYYSLSGKNITVYPTPDANQTGGLKVYEDRSFSLFSYTSEANNDLLTGTKVPGFDSNYHDLLAIGAAYDWRMTKNKDNSLLNDINIMKADLQNHYGSKLQDMQMAFSSLPINYE